MREAHCALLLDCDSCPLTTPLTLSHLLQNVKEFIIKVRYGSPMVLECSLAIGSMISSEILTCLYYQNFYFIPVDETRPAQVDIALIAAFSKIIWYYPPPFIFIICTGNRQIGKALSFLMERQYSVLLVHPRHEAQLLKHVVDWHLDWNEMTRPVLQKTIVNHTIATAPSSVMHLLRSVIENQSQSKAVLDIIASSGSEMTMKEGLDENEEMQAISNAVTAVALEEEDENEEDEAYQMKQWIRNFLQNLIETIVNNAVRNVTNETETNVIETDKDNDYFITGNNGIQQDQIPEFNSQKMIEMTEETRKDESNGETKSSTEMKECIDSNIQNNLSDSQFDDLPPLEDIEPQLETLFDDLPPLEDIEPCLLEKDVIHSDDLPPLEVIEGTRQSDSILDDLPPLEDMDNATDLPPLEEFEPIFILLPSFALALQFIQNAHIDE